MSPPRLSALTGAQEALGQPSEAARVVRGSIFHVGAAKGEACGASSSAGAGTEAGTKAGTGAGTGAGARAGAGARPGTGPTQGESTQGQAGRRRRRQQRPGPLGTRGEQPTLERGREQEPPPPPAAAGALSVSGEAAPGRCRRASPAARPPREPRGDLPSGRRGGWGRRPEVSGSRRGGGGG